MYHLEQSTISVFILTVVKLASYLITSCVSKALRFVDVKVAINQEKMGANGMHGCDDIKHEDPTVKPPFLSEA